MRSGAEQPAAPRRLLTLKPIDTGEDHVSQLVSKGIQSPCAHTQHTKQTMSNGS